VTDRKLTPVPADDGWSPRSWRTRASAQQPAYPDQAALDQVLRELQALPPLVTSWEILALKEHLAEAQEGKRFLLQGGDCPTQPRSQYSGWCRSANPPSISERTKFMVIAERACALTMRRGSGVRAAASNAGPLTMSPR
jgi:3-deoxy-D-arabino-heptulosonate 7-phosphate (DAHP) synthase class II